MKLTKNNKIIAGGVILIICGSLWIRSTLVTSPPPDTPETHDLGTSLVNSEIPTSPQSPTPNITFQINNQILKSYIKKETNVYGLMSQLRTEGKINFVEKNYPGLGEFIVSINNIRSQDGMTWIYYVNGKKSETGVSNYIIKSGDVVTWKYEKEIY